MGPAEVISSLEHKKSWFNSQGIVSNYFMLDQMLSHSFESVIPFAEQQLERLVTQHPDCFPLYTEKGCWSLEGDRWTNWCEGFLGGQLWLLYEQTGKALWLERAEHYSRLIVERRFDRTVHDLGFLFMSTYKRWYDLTGDPELQQILVDAGRTLALRFQRKGKYLCSFIGKQSLFVDIMMNVGLIFYAAQVTGEHNLWDIATQHCQTTRRYLVRGDGSTAHEGIFDLKSGEFLRTSTHQGWRGDSCWARGLAWAIYGFGTVYGYTHDPQDLAIAELTAGYFLAHMPANGIPPNDFDEPAPAHAYESSAAAVAAGGLWQLSMLTPDALHAQVYRQQALTILNTLITPEFLAYETPGWEGLLKHAIYHAQKGIGVDESVMWGDYFFLETLAEVLKDGR